MLVQCLFSAPALTSTCRVCFASSSNVASRPVSMTVAPFASYLCKCTCGACACLMQPKGASFLRQVEGNPRCSWRHSVRTAQAFWKASKIDAACRLPKARAAGTTICADPLMLCYADKLEVLSVMAKWSTLRHSLPIPFR